MRRLTMISCAALVGCASSGASPGPPPPLETVRISGGAGLPTMTVDTRPTAAGAVTTIAFPVDRVWAVMRAAYDSVAIPVSTLDAATHTIGNSSLKTRRRLGNVAMSKYINCGNAQGGPSADTYEIILSVVSRAESAEQGTRLMTFVEAQGRPITLSGEYSRCTSTGGLETRLAQLVTAQLGR